MRNTTIRVREWLRAFFALFSFISKEKYDFFRNRSRVFTHRDLHKTPLSESLHQSLTDEKELIFHYFSSIFHLLCSIFTKIAGLLTPHTPAVAAPSGSLSLEVVPAAPLTPSGIRWQEPVFALPPPALPPPQAQPLLAESNNAPSGGGAPGRDLIPQSPLGSAPSCDSNKLAHEPVIQKINKNLATLRGFYFTEMVSIVLLVLLLGVFFTTFATSTNRYKQPLVFQGRITGSDTIPLADGQYDMRFALYTAADGSGCQWATGSCATRASVPVTVSRGLFTVPFGDTTYHGNMPALALNFENGTFFAGVTICGTTPASSCTEAEMTPRVQMGGTTYSYNADLLDGFESVQFMRTDALTAVTTTPTGTGVGAGTVYINPASAAANTTLLGAAVNGALRALLDAEGDLNLLGSLSSLGLVATTTVATSTATTADNRTAQFAQTGATPGTDYGLHVTNTGAATTNVGGYFSASGATNNYGVIVASGRVGVGTTTPGYDLDVSRAVGSDPSFALTDEDINHGITDLARTNVLALLKSLHATNGGLEFDAFSDSVDGTAFSLAAVIGADPDDGVPAIELLGAKKSGTGYTALTGNEAVFRLNNGGTSFPMTVLGNGNIGFGTSTPSNTVDIAGTLRLSGTTSGYLSIRAPAAVTTSTAFTLPGGDGTNGQVLTTNGSGALSWTTAGSGSVFSGLTAATATNSINNSAYAQTWNWDGLTTQTGLLLSSNSLSGGAVFQVTNNSTSTEAGNTVIFNKTGAYTTNLTYSGNLLRMVRGPSASGGTTLTVTGAALSVNDDCTGAGTCNSSADAAEIIQTYANNTGSALNITTAGTGFALRVNDNGTLTDTSPFVIDDNGFVGVGTTTPGALLTVAGPIATAYAEVTADYTLTDSDSVISVNSASGSVYLPTASSTAGRVYTIIKSTSTAGTIFIKPLGCNGGSAQQTINGSATCTVNFVNDQWKYKTLVSTGSGWIIIGAN